jgi:hypothetical protein
LASSSRFVVKVLFEEGVPLGGVGGDPFAGKVAMGGRVADVDGTDVVRDAGREVKGFKGPEATHGTEGKGLAGEEHPPR